MQKLWCKPMRMTSSYIHLKETRLHAFHGVMPQERKVGALFTVDLRVGYDIAKAMESDDVNDTINYAELFGIVKREMEQPSNLLEHVAGRIAKTIAKTFPCTTAIDLTITKENPPMGADGNGAGVEIHLINDKTI